MSLQTISPERSWSVEAFCEFWRQPDPARAPAVRGIITDDIVGYWPRPIGVARGALAYHKVIESVLTAQPPMKLKIAEHASTGEFTFIRWIGIVTEGGETIEFDGCDRVRVRGGLVCENYVFCDHPYFEVVAKRLREMQ